MSWQNKLTAAFSDWGTQYGVGNFSPKTCGKQVGDRVLGVVVCRTPFGVWVDIGVGYPALLLLTKFICKHPKLDGFVGFPDEGEKIYCEIYVLNENADIGIFQLTKDVVENEI